MLLRKASDRAKERAVGPSVVPSVTLSKWQRAPGAGAWKVTHRRAAASTGALVVLLAGATVACSGGGVGERTEKPLGATASSAAATTATPTSTLLVDADKTLGAPPGEGVGVFVEYGSGGDWNVWWSCDTVRSGRACPYRVRVEVEGDALQDARAEGFASGDAVTEDGPSALVATTRTEGGKMGLRFHTGAGATVIVDADAGGLADGSYYFYVQDGKVNGGRVEAIGNPARFAGRSP